MKISEITCAVIDHGLFLPLAQKLAEHYKRVLYYTPWERGFPLVNESIIGDGFEAIDRIDCLWSHRDEVDLWVFPDIQHSGLQLELERQGCLVWGSRAADEIEMDRGVFLRLLERGGLPVPEYERFVGLSKLQDYLKNAEDCWIKISKYRGNMETWRWHNWRVDECQLDILAKKFGPAKELVEFFAIKNIASDLEVGYDGYCVDGKFPATGIQGYECKDKGFLCAAQAYKDLPEAVRQINEVFGPILAEYRYRNFWSSEIRLLKDKPYFIDPCCRCPSPSTEAQLELYGNLGEIIYGGAQGELVEPELNGKFSAECVITSKQPKGDWRMMDIPAEIRGAIKCGNSCEIDGLICHPPLEPYMEQVGWAVAVGDTPREAINALKDVVAKLPDTVCARIESLAELLKEIDAAEAKGIEFTPMQMPKPSEVIE